MHYELLAQIVIWAVSFFVSFKVAYYIFGRIDAKRFIARLTESPFTRVETEQPGFRPLNMEPVMGDKWQVDCTPSHWRAGEGAACTDLLSQLYAEATVRRRLHWHGVKVGNVLIGGHGLPVEPEMERERR